jgi:hypothetical protein
MNNFAKYTFVTIFMLTVYSIKTSAQENTGAKLFDPDKNMFDLNKAIKDSVLPIFNFHFDNSWLTLKPRIVNEINYNSFSVNHSNLFSLFAVSSDYDWKFEGATSIGFGVNWNITDKLTLSGNPFLTSYYFGPIVYNRKMTVGANIVLTYNINDWLTLRAFSQYAYNGFSNPYLNSVLAPQNSFGGEAIVKFSNTFKFGGGVKYINQGGKWTPQFYTLPLINIDGRKLFKR